LRDHPDIKLIYLVANFQNLAGTTLAPERRKRLLNLAAQYGVRILEDDPYSELRYRGAAVPPIKSFDTEGLVTYISTFSKTIAPGLRVAWVVAEPNLYAKLVMAKQSTDLHTNTISQFAIHLYLTDNDADSHVSKLRQIYGERREAMLQSLARHFPAGVRWTKSEALAKERSYATSSAAESLAVFRKARAETVQLLSGLSEEQFRRTGVFEGYGPLSLRSLAHYLCSHDMQHLSGLQWLLGKIESARTGARG